MSKNISIWVMVFLAVVVISTRCVQANLAYLDFTTTEGLVFNGDAAPAGDVIRVTPSDRYVLGSVWYEIKQNVEYGFTTEFDFRISETTSPSNGSDGFTFVIQNSSLNALGAWGGYMGYGRAEGEASGIANSFVVEFDTYSNHIYYTDMDAPHISVQTRGTEENSASHDFSLGSTSNISNIEDGAVHTARINYVPGELSIILDDSRFPTLTVPVDLSSLLSLDDGTAWVGFTAATGGACENHDILNWQFTEVPEPTSLLLLGLGAVMVRRRRN